MKRILFIWVEGGSDARFFEAVMKPLFERIYKRVEIRTYANLKRVTFARILQGLRAMAADFIVVADIDEEPCVTFKKNYVRSRVRDVDLDPDQIRVVIHEIESWYMAGLGKESSRELGLPLFDRTDAITKEQFIALVPEAFDSRIDFMMELLKTFSLAVARRKNTSFNYFCLKHNFEMGLEIAPTSLTGTGKL